MIYDDILPIPSNVNIRNGMYEIDGNEPLSMNDRFIVRPAKAKHCETVKEYELWKFCVGSQMGA